MLEKIFLISMIILAIISLSTTKLRRAVIYLGLFSLVSSFVYLLYSAPDVAIAEAVIGTTIATVLYLVALKKYRVFTIYFTNYHYDEIDDRYIIAGRSQILRDIEGFLVRNELEPQIIYTPEDHSNILANQNYDLLIHQREDKMYIYGHAEDYHVDNLSEFLSHNKYDSLNISIIRCEEGVGIDA